MRSLQPPVFVSLDAVTYRPEPVPTLLGVLLAFWSSDVELGAHRLSLVQRFLGISWRRISVVWEDLRDARVSGWNLVLHRHDGRSLRTFVRGDPGQLAWIAGQVNARLANLPEREDDRNLQHDREQIVALARRASLSAAAGR